MDSAYFFFSIFALRQCLPAALLYHNSALGFSTVRPGSNPNQLLALTQCLPEALSFRTVPVTFTQLALGQTQISYWAFRYPMSKPQGVTCRAM
jgi:hypothetical protein